MPGRRGRHAARIATGDAGYRDIMRVGGFRALFAAHALSVAGDQVARIAVALLVFARSGSALLTATSYAVTYLPWLVGGPLLSTLGDRMPRRTLMVRCDLARAGLVAVMALPGLPLWSLFVLVLAVTTLEPPFQSARAAVVPAVLGDQAFALGQSLMTATAQAMQVLGFVAGGIVTGLLTAQGALLLDAVSFLASAALLDRGLSAYAPVASPGPRSLTGDLLRGVRQVFGHRTTRAITLIAWTGAAVGVVPDGLAVVYARAHGGGPVTAGVLTAALPFGYALGSLVLPRVTRLTDWPALLAPLALLQCAPLALTPLAGGVVVAGLLWVVAGIGATFMVVAYRLFVIAIPEHMRASAFGVTGTGVYVAQGLALTATGALAGVTSATVAVGVAGAAGMVVVAGVAARQVAQGQRLAAGDEIDLTTAEAVLP